MDNQRDIFGMLDMMQVPAFCGKDNTIIYANTAAQGLLIGTGDLLMPMISSGAGEYAAFQDGTLCLTLRCQGKEFSAFVNRTEVGDVFALEPESWRSELNSLALASRELREPLSGIMLSVEKMLPLLRDQEAARLNRDLYRMLRILGNMSDAAVCSLISHQETVNITAVMAELFEKARTTLEQVGFQLEYQGPDCPIYTMADTQQLERSVWNLLSNSVKFTPPGGRIQVNLVRREHQLRLCIQDNGSGIPRDLLPTVFSRYLRQPAIEDGRFGIGLGMVLVRSAAANHGGAVLIHPCDGGGTGITFTMAIRQNPDTLLRCPTLRADYCGERDHALVELADILPTALYKK